MASPYQSFNFSILHGRNGDNLKDSRSSSIFLFNNYSTLISNHCSRDCKRRDTKIYLGISNDEQPKWLIEIFLRGKRTIIEGDKLIKQGCDCPDSMDVPTSLSGLLWESDLYNSPSH
ncbi:hypothetical protein LIER_25846 [Lithospermum erythrorhizon]|uniref:Uncharacterized protein n=1 Tax=Lithospermum erythrorhizon TaxID=34254 RepID=A0AAV3R7T4_LITER